MIMADVTKILCKLAEWKAIEADSKICILKKATKILWWRTQNVLKIPVEFSGSVPVKHNENNSPHDLMLVLKMVALRR